MPRERERESGGWRKGKDELDEFGFFRIELDTVGVF